MNKIDKQILDGLVAGLPVSDIAASLNIPLDWVLEMQNNMPVFKIDVNDLPKIYGMN